MQTASVRMARYSYVAYHLSLRPDATNAHGLLRGNQPHQGPDFGVEFPMQCLLPIFIVRGRWVLSSETIWNYPISNCLYLTNDCSRETYFILTLACIQTLSHTLYAIHIHHNALIEGSLGV